MQLDQLVSPFNVLIYDLSVSLPFTVYVTYEWERT